jgi:hypothetical protein
VIQCLVVSLSIVCSSILDPAGDVYYPGAPNEPALGTAPDLLWGEAVLDRDHGQLRFRFGFADNVYPADDFEHYDSQLWGCVDIDLDVPPVGTGVSKKSELSGCLSDLGIEAYVDLGWATGGSTDLCDPNGNPISSVPISFSQNVVEIDIPLVDVYWTRPVGDRIACAAYFYDPTGSVADVFPNGRGYLISPEPGSATIVVLALCGWLSKQSGGRLRLTARRNARRRANT